MGMALPNLTSFSTPPTAVAVPAPAPDASTPNTASFSSAEDHSKKVRKPYTITKSRESWTDPEHDKFLEALHLFDRDWKKIEAFIGSKTVIQIRSHAQKYFLKVQKNGTNEHLPPPRPKRKAAHPYPQKASKSASALPQAAAALQDSKLLPEHGFPQRTSPSVLKNPVSGAAAPCRNENSVGETKISTVDLKSERQSVTSNYCFSNLESTPISKAKPVDEMTHQGNHGPQRVLPDFAVVYKFLGSVFDPDGTDHLQNLRRMDPIDVETVLLLMRNLSVNLTSPDFEDHRKLLSSYEIESVKENNDPNSFIVDKCEDTAIGTTE